MSVQHDACLTIIPQKNVHYDDPDRDEESCEQLVENSVHIRSYHIRSKDVETSSECKETSDSRHFPKGSFCNQRRDS
jgi:hypothetical protein